MIEDFFFKQFKLVTPYLIDYKIPTKYLKNLLRF